MSMFTLSLTQPLLAIARLFFRTTRPRDRGQGCESE